MTNPEDGLPGNEYSSTAYYAAELVTSNLNPLFDGTVANAYATLALAQEQRMHTLAVLSDNSDRTTAERAQKELREMMGWASEQV